MRARSQATPQNRLPDRQLQQHLRRSKKQHRRRRTPTSTWKEKAGRRRWSSEEVRRTRRHEKMPNENPRPRGAEAVQW